MSEWKWKNFTEAEFKCKCGNCDGGQMIAEFMDKLQALRDAYGKAMPVSSGYRCPAYNTKVSATGPSGPHTTGRAADITVRGKDAFTILKLAFFGSFTGIGVNQKGATRFIHLDDLSHPPRPNVWSY